MRRRLLLRRVHRLSAVILGIYALPHLTNHLLARSGPQRHSAIMAVLRQAYRQPLVEAILLAAVLAQVVTGSLQLRASRGQKVGWFVQLQRWAGLVLAVFLCQHVSAILFGRVVARLDYAAAVLVKFPHVLYFAPRWRGGEGDVEVA
jgi:succinate dehydrogenase/fumarate reductase cytochrome b subunit